MSALHDNTRQIEIKLCKIAANISQINLRIFVASAFNFPAIMINGSPSEIEYKINFPKASIFTDLGIGLTLAVVSVGVGVVSVGEGSLSVLVV